MKKLCFVLMLAVASLWAEKLDFDGYLEKGRESFLAKDYKQAKNYFIKACEANTGTDQIGYGKVFFNQNCSSHTAMEYFGKDCDSLFEADYSIRYYYGVNTYGLCVQVGDIYYEGNKELQVEKNIPLAKEYWAKGIFVNSRSWYGGMMGGSGYFIDEGEGWEDENEILAKYLSDKNPDYTKARLFFEIGCEKRKYEIDGLTEEMSLGYHCAILGNLYKQGLGVQQDYKKALQYYKTACETPVTGSMYGRYGGTDSKKYYCDGLGDMYYLGLGVKQDYKMAKKYWAKSIIRWETDLSDGYGPRREYKEVTGIYTQALHLLNKGYITKARLLAEVGCDEFLDSTSCKILGDIYSQGKGVVANQNTANAYYAKYKQYEQIEREYSKCDDYDAKCLLEFSLKACKLGKKIACENAESHKQTIKEKNMISFRNSYYESYKYDCDNGDKETCNELKDIIEKYKSYKKDCKNGDKDICNFIEEFEELEKRVGKL